MRGEYATIHTAIVDDPEFQALSPPSRYVWYTLKLLLGASGIDLIRAHLASLSAATGYPINRLSDTLAELEKGGWLVRQGDILWLRNALRFNPQFNLTNPKHATHLRNHLEGLPRLKIVADFAAYYSIEAPFKPIENGYPTDTLCDTGSGSGTDLAHTTAWPASLVKADGKYTYPELFEEAWANYPQRDGDNPKVGAYRAFRARVKAGDDPAALIASASHYRDHCRAKGKEGTEYVQQAATFWGPKKETWREYVDGPGNGTPKDDRGPGFWADPEDYEPGGLWSGEPRPHA